METYGGMILIRKLFSAGLCALVGFAAPTAMAAPPKQTIYTCSLKVAKNQSWVPEEVVVIVNKTDGKVLVFDPIIRYFMTNPIPAKVVVNTADRLTLKWTVKRINKVKPSNAPNFNYVAKITKKDKRIAIDGTPMGYDNRFYSDGVCKVKE